MTPQTFNLGSVPIFFGHLNVVWLEILVERELVFVSSNAIHYTLTLMRQLATYISVLGQILPSGVQLQIRQCPPSRQPLGPGAHSLIPGGGQLRWGVATVPSPIPIFPIVEVSIGEHISPPTVCTATTTSDMTYPALCIVFQRGLYSLLYLCVTRFEMGDIYTNYSPKGNTHPITNLGISLRTPKYHLQFGKF